MPVACLLLLSLAQIHEPPVTRAAFEDRSRMVLFNPAPGLWMAFNPDSCTLQKVWEGDVDWRGKVFDFSQDNSRAKGRSIYEVPSTLMQLEDGKPGNWTLSGVAWKDGWSFAGAGSYIESPSFSAPGFTRLCVMFDETSRKGPVRAELLDREGTVESWFESTKHGHSDTDWQFNMKLLPIISDNSRLRVTQPGDFGKKLRAVRVFADWHAWDPATSVTWRGYRYDKAKNVLTCLADISGKDGKVTRVEQDLGADKEKWWTEVRSEGSSPLDFRMHQAGSNPVAPGQSSYVPVAKGKSFRREYKRSG